MVRVSACHEKTWTHFPCLKLSLEFAKKIGYIFWEFEFFNVAKCPALARLIIRYSVFILLQNVNIFMLRNNSGESISYTFAFGIEGLSNFFEGTNSNEKTEAARFFFFFISFFTCTTQDESHNLITKIQETGIKRQTLF